MPPNTDPAIPPLVNDVGAATMLGVTRERVRQLRTDGRIPYRYVGPEPLPGVKARRPVVIRTAVLKAYLRRPATKHDAPGHPVIDEKLPVLYRTSDVATRLGLTRGGVHRMWEYGHIKGYSVPGYENAFVRSVGTLLFTEAEVVRVEKLRAEQAAERA